MKNLANKTFLLLFLLYFLFSFVLTDPNLIILKSEVFVAFQLWFWENILPNSFLRSLIYLIISLLLFINYLIILKNLAKEKFSFLQLRLQIKKYYLPILIILLLSYNALSHDIFNYMFNAKMVINYQSNPHQSVALDFPDDSWLRFMNNVHTPAPYGYVWTAISLPIFLLGLNKFILIWLSFKFFSLLPFLLCLFFLNKILIKENRKDRIFDLALLALNPLLLIEVVSNGHNDFWMLLPALMSLYLAKYYKNWLLKIILASILLMFSINTKFASIVFIPLLFYLWLNPSVSKLFARSLFEKYWCKIRKFLEYYFFDLASLLIFVPLLTSRSQLFHPWYLSWPLLFLPLLRSKLYRNLLLAFTLSSLLRYLPWLYYLPWMNFDREVPNFLVWQQAISFLLPAFYLLLYGLAFLFNRYRVK